MIRRIQERLSNDTTPEFDQELRGRLHIGVSLREVEAEAHGLRKPVTLFGQPVNVIKVARSSGESLRIYIPSHEAQVAGYVPSFWVEFLAGGVEDGCFLEIRQNTNLLVKPIITELGEKPEPLPVNNTRILVARAMNTVENGILVDPEPQDFNTAA